MTSIHQEVKNIRKNSCGFCKCDDHTIIRCKHPGIEVAHQKLLRKIQEKKNIGYQEYIMLSIKQMESVELIGLYAKFKIPSKLKVSEKKNILKDIYDHIEKSDNKTINSERLTYIIKNNKTTKNQNDDLEERNRQLEEERQDRIEIDEKVKDYENTLKRELMLEINEVVSDIVYESLLKNYSMIVMASVNNYFMNLVDRSKEKRKLLNMDKIPFEVSSYQDCPICLEKVTNKNAIKTNCDHIHCYDCIKYCVELCFKDDTKKKLTCSLCRTEVTKLYKKA
jgi:hypothetical protein